MNGTSSKHRREGAFDLSMEAPSPTDNIPVKGVYESTVLQSLGVPLSLEAPAEQILSAEMNVFNPAVPGSRPADILHGEGPLVVKATPQSDDNAGECTSMGLCGY